MPNTWKEKTETVRRRDVGKSIVYLERYFFEEKWRYYIDASGPDYRVWKRTKGSEGRAVEIYQRYVFWVWLIEAFGHWYPATRFLTWVMHKTI